VIRKCLLVCILLFCCPSAADETEGGEFLVTAKFVHVSLREALEEVAQIWGKSLHCGGHYEGQFSGSFVDTPVEVALARILVARH
jgi:type II secretory pathway component GspD/PulD (secretin)